LRQAYDYWQDQPGKQSFLIFFDFYFFFKNQKIFFQLLLHKEKKKKVFKKKKIKREKDSIRSKAPAFNWNDFFLFFFFFQKHFSSSLLGINNKKKKTRKKGCFKSRFSLFFFNCCFLSFSKKEKIEKTKKVKNHFQ